MARRGHLQQIHHQHQPHPIILHLRSPRLLHPQFPRRIRLPPNHNYHSSSTSGLPSSPSKFDRGLPKSSPSGSPKSSSSSFSPSPSKSDSLESTKEASHNTESPSEEVSSPPSPTTEDKVSDFPSHEFDSLAPATSDIVTIKATCTVSVRAIVGFFLL
ncbi:hypothetical protein V6N12_045122 [Hibiscus sabdariffa]|uniref:Uncharacterized protein n=1 Tax=Hibiscus sabdariffa TaxID=183260 RepID=A0ABR2G2B7_9ROSI